MGDVFKTALEKYGPLGLALIVMAYLLYQSEGRAEKDRAFFYLDLAQQMADLHDDVSKTCSPR